MRELDEQIRLLADAAFARTTSVALDASATPRATPPARRRATRHRRGLALVAALAVCVGGAGAIARIDRLGGDDDFTVAGDVHHFSHVDDALVLDLDGAIAVSRARRVAAVGPVLTFDLDALPDGWSAEQSMAVTSRDQRPVGISTEGPTDVWYRQQIDVTTPDRVGLVVNVEGPLVVDPGKPVLLTTSDGQTAEDDVRGSGDAVEVRGQPASLDLRSMRWVEQERAVVEIVRGPGVQWAIADVSAEMRTLAEHLQPIVADLAWSLEDDDVRRGAAGEVTDSTLLAGTLDGVSWRVEPDGEDVELYAGGRPFGGTVRVEPDDPTLALYSIGPLVVPGGAIVYGRAPASVASIRLDLANAAVDLPVVRFGSRDRVAFAIPLADELDPESFTLLDADGRPLAVVDLSHLPPYLGGVTGTSVRVGG